MVVRWDVLTLSDGRDVGCWGHKVFENDDAQDWVAQMLEDGDSESTQRVLEKIPGATYPDASDCAMALAAAEVVAAARHRPSTNLPEEIHAWLLEHHLSANESLTTFARKVVTSIKAHSELRDLWKDSDDDFRKWNDVLDDLSDRLS